MFEEISEESAKIVVIFGATAYGERIAGAKILGLKISEATPNRVAYKQRHTQGTDCTLSCRSLRSFQTGVPCGSYEYGSVEEGLSALKNQEEEDTMV